MTSRTTLADPVRLATPAARYRVGIFIETVAGWATYRQNLQRAAGAVVELDPTWHDISYHRPGGALETLHERWLRFVPDRHIAAGRAALEFDQALRDGPYDAIMTNSAATLLFSRRLRSVPTMGVIDATRRQLDRMEGYGDSRRSVLKERIKWHLARRVSESTALIVATSRWAKAGMVEEYGVPPEKVVVIPFAVDPTFWRPPRDRTIRDDATRRVLFVGGDFRRKGGELLLDWYRRRPHRGIELHVVTREPVDAFDGVVVHDAIEANTPELLALYQQADVFVLPSLAEAFGIATLEAMACGLPVVVSDSGGSADIVDHGFNGFITEAGDPGELDGALETLLADADLRASMGERSRRIAVERFDIEATARRTLGLLADLAAGRRS